MGCAFCAEVPGFTAIAAVSLALAIGANTTIFSVAKRVLLDRLSVPHPDELRMLRWNGDGKEVVHGMWGDFDTTQDGVTRSSVFSYPVYLQLRAHNDVLQDLIAFKEDGMNATVHGNAQRVDAAMVSGNFYSGLGVHPQLGRALQPSDDTTPGSGTVAMISDGLWQREFDRSPSVLGQTITLNQTAMTIVGVNPRGFTGAKNVQQAPDIVVPISMQPVIDPKREASILNDPGLWWVNVIGRIKPGIKTSQAQAALDVQLQAAVRATMVVSPGDTMPRLELADGSRGLHSADGMLKKPVYVLLALTGFVVLLACANIANLLLARGAQRQKEMSVRLAMGAGRARILRQLFTESLLLAGLGGLGGLLLGYFGSNAIPRLLTNGWERIDYGEPLDWGVFAFTTAVTLLTGVLFGLAPAWLAARSEVSSDLKETARTATRRRKGLGGKAIVAFQIALSTLLVLGAGLFVRTLIGLNSVDVGFNADNLMLFEISPPARRYPHPKDVQLHQQLEQRLATVPGVEKVAPGWIPYISESMGNTDFVPEGETFDKNKRQAEFENAVGVNFFPTMSIPIVAGRDFGSRGHSYVSKSGDRKSGPGAEEISRMRIRSARDSEPIKSVRMTGFRLSASVQTRGIPTCMMIRRLSSSCLTHSRQEWAAWSTRYGRACSQLFLCPRFGELFSPSTPTCR